MDRTELAAWLRLLLSPGIGKISARKLLIAFGFPTAVFAQTEAALTTVVSAAQSRSLLGVPEELATLVASTWDWLCAEPDTRRILTLGDPLYPQRLLETDDPPLLLYAIGMPVAWQNNLLNNVGAPCLAIVGSRNPTPQGANNAHQFAQTLAEAGLTIVSGMAIGVDGAAHEGALQGAAVGSLATIAVVGTGLDRVYPRQHRDLAHRIAQRGMILSEFPLGTGPLAANFPQRNRIISGLSCGTLVVEAALKSGSLITARMAAEQGRDVFAIPGSIHATQSRGCHALIKQGAKLVESALDVLEELPLDSKDKQRHAVASVGAPADVMVADDALLDSPLLQALGFDASSMDSLQARTGLPTADLLAQLMNLELQGALARLPGGLYQRLVRA